MPTPKKIITPLSKEAITPFFEPFTNLILSNGGDGTGIIVTRFISVKDVADWYDEWNKTQMFPWKREDHEDGHVSFWDNQEGILIFSGDLYQQSLENYNVYYKFGDYFLII